MQSYMVTFQIDIESDSPEHAAVDALQAIRDPSGLPPVLGVRAEDGTATDVDLADVLCV